jgi:8-oxo-dGTP pyrophosphatase MutT (NUDIX family)
MARELRIEEIRAALARRAPIAIPAARVERRAAVAIVLRQSEELATSEILFILRAQHREDPWSGHMAFPGGRVEQDDPSPLEAALRETSEEVGVDLARCGRLLGQIDETQASAGGRTLPLAIVPFVFELVEPVLPRANAEEVDQILWVTLGELLDPAFRGTTPYEIYGQHYDLPCIRARGQVIWGLTYRMLMQLFAAVGD